MVVENVGYLQGASQRRCRVGARCRAAPVADRRKPAREPAARKEFPTAHTQRLQGRVFSTRKASHASGFLATAASGKVLVARRGRFDAVPHGVGSAMSLRKGNVWG